VIRNVVPRLAILGAVALGAAAPASAAAAGPFIDGLHTVSTLGSTVPANGDVNPYGIVTVPRSSGRLVRGDLLISNFNSWKNLQGTGTTIVQMTPKGTRRTFAKINPAALPGSCSGGVGLSTALVALRRGFVIVGSLPTKNGMAATAKAGCLLVLNSSGKVVETFAGGVINGPWDMNPRRRHPDHSAGRRRYHRVLGRGAERSARPRARPRRPYPRGQRR